MGTHVKGPSRVFCSNDKMRPLGEILTAHPGLLGDAVYKRFDCQLPFLFKVLSVNKSLSIQAHPTKEHAEMLYSRYPNLYPDPNHKPELAIGEFIFL